MSNDYNPAGTSFKSVPLSLKDPVPLYLGSKKYMLFIGIDGSMEDIQRAVEP